MKQWITYPITLILAVLMIAGSMQVSVFTMTCHFSGRTVAELTPIESCGAHSTTNELVFKAQCCDFAKFQVEFDQNYVPGKMEMSIAAIPMALLSNFSTFSPQQTTFQELLSAADLPPPNILSPTAARLQVFQV